MNKPKAPKDMTAPELVAEIRKRHSSGKYCGLCTISMTQLDEMMDEPAPNPFTPDQLVVLRELQRSGFNYAATDANEEVFLYENEPEKDDDGYWWDASEAGGNYVESPFAFLTEVLSTGDKCPIRFSDYTLEGAADV